MLARNVILVELEFHDIPIEELLERQLFFSLLFGITSLKFFRFGGSAEIFHEFYVRFIRDIRIYVMCFKLLNEKSIALVEGLLRYNYLLYLLLKACKFSTKNFSTKILENITLSHRCFYRGNYKSR